MEVSGVGKSAFVCERLGVYVCVCVARYKEGQWRGSGIIWRGRCCNILSWITALYTGEMDGGNNRQAASRREGWGGGEEGKKKRRTGRMTEGK